MPKIVYAGTREESFFPELWSAQAKETAARLGYEIAIPGFTRFEGTRERWREFLAGAEGIVTTWFSPRIDAGILRVAPKLRIVGHAAGSLAGYVSPELFEAGVKVTSANTDMAHAVAEWCLMGALMGRRNVAAYSEFGTAGRLNFPGRSACGSVRNAVVGIWGFGMVAEHLVRMLEPLRPAKVLVFSGHLAAARAAELGVELAGFEEVLRRSDILFTLAGLNRNTAGMLDASRLALLKDGMTLVNGGRGQLMNEADFYAELARGRFNAVLDVYHQEPLPAEHILHTLPNVVLTPHNAGYPSRSSYIATVLEEFGRCFRNEPLRNEVAPEKIAFMTENCVNR